MVPGSRRSRWFVESLTMTSPLRPWGLVICPTSNIGLVDDVDRGFDALRRARRPHDRADGLGHPTPPADDLAHVVGRHVQREHDAAAALAHVDADGLGLVDDGLGEVLEDLL